MDDFGGTRAGPYRSAQAPLDPVRNTELVPVQAALRRRGKGAVDSHIVLRTLIVDDEPLAIEGLRRLLEAEPDVEVVGNARDGEQALASIEQLRPDLVFMDVEMPGCDGFEVVHRTEQGHHPLFVFVTAHSERGPEAFDVHAVDYLLKPVMQPRLREALRRVRQSLEGDHGHQDDDGIHAPAKAEGGYASRLAVRARDRYVVLSADQVSWLEATGNYVKVHASGRSYLMRTTMIDLEAQLNPGVFSRVHRTAIVNLNHVREIVTSQHGDHSIVLEDGTSVRLSRTYRARVFSQLYRGRQTDD